MNESKNLTLSMKFNILWYIMHRLTFSVKMSIDVSYDIEDFRKSRQLSYLTEYVK